MPSGVRRILVLCTGNSARSQVAEALLTTLGAGRIEARSAGSHPAPHVNPHAIDVLARHGIAWGDRTPRHVDSLADQRFDLVITVCDNARDACPLFPGAATQVHWGLPDPAEEIDPARARAAFLRTYDELRRRIERLLALPLDTLEPDALRHAAQAIHDAQVEGPVLRRLSALDRWLPLWIFVAMAAGVLLGRAFPDLGVLLDRVQVAGVSVPIGIGLLWMMYPVLAKVRYEAIGGTTRDPRVLITSLVLNWVVGPLLMFGLAWAFLPDLPAYRNGMILIGLARCIAMVLVWNNLAHGSAELAAVLVALNSVFQVATYSLLGWLFLEVVPGWFGAEGTALDISMLTIGKSVLIFLGIPLLAGYLTRRVLVARRGLTWYDQVFMPRFGPTALLGLLYTIVLMFAMQGHRILELPLDVLRIAVPLLVYFGLMFAVAFFASRRQRFDYPTAASVSFTAAGNNFELAIAVAVATFGIGSGEALAAVVGPLIEVPALVGLVYVALWARRRFYPAT